MRKRKKLLVNLALSALFLALGFVLPFLTGQIPQIGSMLLPMHIPVLLCGLIVGWQYGAVIGFILPLLRSVCFGMPPIFPTAVSMTFELCAYGLFSGLVYRFLKLLIDRYLKDRNPSKVETRLWGLGSIFASLIAAMILGRGVWGIAQLILLAIQGNPFTWSAFLSGAFITAWPGIIVQLILIPAVMEALDGAKILISYTEQKRVDDDPELKSNVDRVLTSIQEREADGKTLLVAIDGRCASGKTTLAKAVAARLGCPVVHMDDFFLQPGMRTEERLSQPGGNVDYERVLSQVITPLKNGEEAVYQPYDCHLDRLIAPVHIQPTRVVLIEGSYSLHPALKDSYGLKVFITVDPQEQERRLKKRETPESLEKFKTQWIPLEEQYISSYSPDSCADISLVSREPAKAAKGWFKEKN